MAKPARPASTSRRHEARRFASSASIRASVAPAGASSRSPATRLPSSLRHGQGAARRRTRARVSSCSMTASPRSSRTARPDEAAVEQTFVNRDATATLKLGQARGIALLVPAQAGLGVAEYAPNAVKKTIVGAGHAEKVQIRAMVRVLLPRADIRQRRCRRCARDRDLPRPSSRIGGRPRRGRRST